MDKINLIRAGIFLLGGLVSILFREQLNNIKNKWLVKFNMKKRVKDERKTYVYMGIILIIISIILFIYSITR
jgi:uncharacterized membrane protein